MQSIYDWVKSLHIEPVHFNLFAPMSSTFISPSRIVHDFDRTILTMTAAESTPANASDEPISFICYHVDFITKLEEKKKEYPLSPVIKTIFLDRENVFEKHFDSYRNDPYLIEHTLTVRFNNEEASGDGIAREAFSLFLEQLFVKTFESKNNFILILQPEFGKKSIKLLDAFLCTFLFNLDYFLFK